MIKLTAVEKYYESYIKSNDTLNDDFFKQIKKNYTDAETQEDKKDNKVKTAADITLNTILSPDITFPKITKEIKTAIQNNDFKNYMESLRKTIKLADKKSNEALELKNTAEWRNLIKVIEEGKTSTFSSQFKDKWPGRTKIYNMALKALRDSLKERTDVIELYMFLKGVGEKDSEESRRPVL